MSSSLQAKGWKPSVADWGDGMSAGCTAGSVIIRYHEQTAVALARANQLPQSASGHESDSCKVKYRTLTLLPLTDSIVTLTVSMIKHKCKILSLAHSLEDSQ